MLIPSCTTPMFSNKDDTSHIIHCDIPLILRHIAIAIAIEPVETMDDIQSHIASAEIVKTRKALLI